MTRSSRAATIVRDAAALARRRERARLQGTLAVRNGADWEGTLDLALSAYRAKGELVAADGNPSTVGKPATPGKRDGSMYFGAPAAVDWTGVLRGGRALAFDAKVIGRDAAYRLHPSDARTFAKDCRQLEFLRDVQDLGGVGFLLLRDRELDRVYVLTDVRRLLPPTLGAVAVRSIERAQPAKAIPACVVDRLPRVLPGSTLAVARGRPLVDFVPVALAADAELRRRGVLPPLPQPLTYEAP